MTTLDEADKKARLGRARETGLFRYSLVQELAEPGITAAERGRRARELASFDRRLGRPFMMIYSARPGRMGANDPIYAPSASPYYRADVADTGHLDFADFILWPAFRERGIPGAIVPERALSVTRELVREYFDQVLRSQPSALLAMRRTLQGVTVASVTSQVKTP